ncbi:MucR family transcriptional regulator [Methylobacterium oryzae CBMB20]
MTVEYIGHAPEVTELAGRIIAAYVSNNPVPVSELPNLIRSVHSAISGLTSGAALGTDAPAAQVEKRSAAQIRKSVQHDGIVSFIDGKTYKTLKRHLTANGLDPHSYRERYGLPTDYLMVCPSYSAQRSALAQAIGLGVPGAMAKSTPKGRREAA